MKLLIRYDTSLGPRTVVVEAGDPVMAMAVANAHRTLGGYAECVEEIPRYSLKSHMLRHKKRIVKMWRIIERWKRRNNNVRRLPARLRSIPR